ncbi:MAG: hypothetical protein MJE68_12950 [Proteobacteria bacterium]|nr:hypothetical protein [Pseudomonadota bacterium]
MPATDMDLWRCDKKDKDMDDISDIIATIQEIPPFGKRFAKEIMQLASDLPKK